MWILFLSSSNSASNSSLNASISRIVLLNWKTREVKQNVRGRFKPRLDVTQQDYFHESQQLRASLPRKRRGQRPSPAPSTSATSRWNLSVHLRRGAVSADCLWRRSASRAWRPVRVRVNVANRGRHRDSYLDSGACDREWPYFCWSRAASEGPTWARAQPLPCGSWSPRRSGDGAPLRTRASFLGEDACVTFLQQKICRRGPVAPFYLQSQPYVMSSCVCSFSG